MPVILRNTILSGENRILTLEGLGNHKVQMTSNSIITGGVEILTENIKNLRAVPRYRTGSTSSVVQPIKTDNGYLYTKDNNLVLVNEDGIITAEVSLEIIFILKVMSTRRNHSAEKSRLYSYPFTEASQYSFIKTGEFSRDDFKKRISRKGRFVKYLDNYLALNEDYLNIARQIESINGPGQKPDTSYMKHILDNNIYTTIENRKFLIYNGSIVEIAGTTARLVLPVDMHKLKE